MFQCHHSFHSLTLHSFVFHSLTVVEGNLDGSKMGPLEIPANKMSRQVSIWVLNFGWMMYFKVWDYVLLSKPYPAECGIEEEKLKQLRKEFEFWYVLAHWHFWHFDRYPVDLRVSGKDLLNNHLPYYIYNHLAIWGEVKFVIFQLLSLSSPKHRLEFVETALPN